jgi:hypothetical protein
MTTARPIVTSRNCAGVSGPSSSSATRSAAAFSVANWRARSNSRAAALSRRRPAQPDADTFLGVPLAAADPPERPRLVALQVAEGALPPGAESEELAGDAAHLAEEDALHAAPELGLDVGARLADRDAQLAPADPGLARDVLALEMGLADEAGGQGRRPVQRIDRPARHPARADDAAELEVGQRAAHRRPEAVELLRRLLGLAAEADVGVESVAGRGRPGWGRS